MQKILGIDIGISQPARYFEQFDLDLGIQTFSQPVSRIGRIYIKAVRVGGQQRGEPEALPAIVIPGPRQLIRRIVLQPEGQAAQLILAFIDENCRYDNTGFFLMDLNFLEETVNEFIGCQR